MDPIAAAAEALADAKQILVFTGAGISTESGIPDFRGPDGVWTRVDPEEFTYARYMENPDTRKASWRMRAESNVLDAEPNAAHHAVVALWEKGRLTGCVTQNIDGLHQRAGLPADAVVELHGNAHRTGCVDCQRGLATEAVVARVEAGEDDPRCEWCGGILKAAVVFFGEQMPAAEMVRASIMAERADAVIAVGSTLSVFPAASFPLDVAGQGHPLVIVNQGPTDFDELATVKVEGAAGEVLPRLVEALG